MKLAGQNHRPGENLGLQRIWTQLPNYQITQLPIPSDSVEIFFRLVFRAVTAQDVWQVLGEC